MPRLALALVALGGYLGFACAPTPLAPRAEPAPRWAGEVAPSSDAERPVALASTASSAPTAAGAPRVTRDPPHAPCWRGSNPENRPGPGALVFAAGGARAALLCGIVRVDVVDLARHDRVVISVDAGEVELGSRAIGFRRDGARLLVYAGPYNDAAPFALDLATAELKPLLHAAPLHKGGVRGDDPSGAFWPSDDWSRVLEHDESGAVLLVDGFGGARRTTVLTDVAEVFDARFSADGAIFAIAGVNVEADGKPPSPSAAFLELHDGATGDLRARLGTSTAERPWTRVHFSADQKTLFALRELPIPPVNDPAFMADRKQELVAWDVSTRRQAGRWVGLALIPSASGAFVYRTAGRRDIERVTRATGAVAKIFVDEEEGYSFGFGGLTPTPDDRLLLTTTSGTGGTWTTVFDAKIGGTVPW